MSTLAELREQFPHLKQGWYLAERAKLDRDMFKPYRLSGESAEAEYRAWYEATHGMEYAPMPQERPADEFDGPNGAFKFKNVPTEILEKIMVKTKKYKMQLEVTASWHDGEKTRFNGFATKGN